LVQTSGLGGEAAIFAGRKQAGEVAQFMQAADIVCLASHNEGVPNVLLEALASGRPLVSTDVGGLSEILGPSPNGGVLVRGRDPQAFAAALDRVLSALPDPGGLSAYAAQFSWPKCAAEYWAAIDGAHSSRLASRQSIN
jgi:glycosyltransferase involved in cell wall biosynthesis